MTSTKCLNYTYLYVQLVWGPKFFIPTVLGENLQSYKKTKTNITSPTMVNKYIKIVLMYDFDMIDPIKGGQHSC